MVKADLLGRALPGSENNEVLGIERIDAQQLADCLALCQVQEVDDRTALRGAPHIWNFVNPQPVDTPLVRIEQDVVMGRGDKEGLDEISLFLIAPGDAATAAALVAIGAQRGALDVAFPGKGDRHLFLGNEILSGVILRLLNDLGAPLIPKLLLRLSQLFDNQVENKLLAGENFPVVLDVRVQLVQLVLKLLALQPGQPPQLHDQDLVSLDLGELVLGHQAGLGLLIRLGRPD